MINFVTRFVCMAVGAVSGYAVSQLVDWQSQIGIDQTYVIFIFIILGWSIGYVVGGIISRELSSAWHHAEDHIRTFAFADVLLGTAGLLVGLLLATMLAWPLRGLRPEWLAVSTMVLMMVILGGIGVRVALIKKRDFVAAFPRFGVDRVDQATGLRSRVLLLDTSAVIDGRFADMVRLGFLQGDLRVPRFVLSELQTLADSADDTRRARGRRGLDLLTTLQTGAEDVQTFEIDYPEVPDVDDKLMRLAQETDGVLLTVDHNLTQVARVRGIVTLNVNELAGVMRPSYLPGEALRLRVVREGKEADQGVGYLEDGTMVVIQGGRDHLGDTVDAEVTSVLQTSAGRMIFARVRAIDAHRVETPVEST